MYSRSFSFVVTPAPLAPVDPCWPLLVGFSGPVEHVESAAEPIGESNNSLTAQLSESVHERMNRKEEGEAP